MADYLTYDIESRHLSTCSQVNDIKSKLLSDLFQKDTDSEGDEVLYYKAFIYYYRNFKYIQGYNAKPLNEDGLAILIDAWDELSVKYYDKTFDELLIDSIYDTKEEFVQAEWAISFSWKYIASKVSTLFKPEVFYTGNENIQRYYALGFDNSSIEDLEKSLENNRDDWNSVENMYFTFKKDLLYGRLYPEVYYNGDIEKILEEVTSNFTVFKGSVNLIINLRLMECFTQTIHAYGANVETGTAYGDTLELYNYINYSNSNVTSTAVITALLDYINSVDEYTEGSSFNIAKFIAIDNGYTVASFLNKEYRLGTFLIYMLIFGDRSLFKAFNLRPISLEYIDSNCSTKSHKVSFKFDYEIKDNYEFSSDDYKNTVKFFNQHYTHTETSLGYVKSLYSERPITKLVSSFSFSHDIFIDLIDKVLAEIVDELYDYEGSKHPLYNDTFTISGSSSTYIKVRTDWILNSSIKEFSETYFKMLTSSSTKIRASNTVKIFNQILMGLGIVLAPFTEGASLLVASTIIAAETLYYQNQKDYAALGGLKAASGSFIGQLFKYVTYAYIIYNVYTELEQLATEEGVEKLLSEYSFSTANGAVGVMKVTTNYLQNLNQLGSLYLKYKEMPDRNSEIEKRSDEVKELSRKLDNMALPNSIDYERTKFEDYLYLDTGHNLDNMMYNMVQGRIDAATTKYLW